MYSCDGKDECPLFMSFKNHSNMIWCSIFFIIINVEKTVAYNFMEAMIHFHFRIFGE